MRKKFQFGLPLLLVLSVGSCGIDLGTLKLGIEESSPLVAATGRDENLAEKVGLELDVLVLRPDQDKIDMLQSGEIDLAFIHNSHPYTEGVSVLLPVYRDVLHVFVRPSIVADDLQDLLGGRLVFVPGRKSTEMQLLLSMRESKAYSQIDFRITDSREDDADVLFIMAPLSSDSLQALLTDWRLFSFADPEELGPGGPIDLIKYNMPRLQTVIIPKGMYGPDYLKPIVTLGVDTILAGRKELPGPLVYLMMKALIENKPYFTSLSPIFFEYLGQEPDPNTYNLPMHAGAWRYFNRDEPDFLERYAELINTGLYALVLVGSVGIAIYRSRRKRKKNRIDVFYAQLLALRQRSQTERDTTALCAEVRRIEAEAFQLLIDEQLVADESMTIFLLQVQNMIAELENRA
ncbi:MAG: TRAP-type uncharacterized transport system substrate-binding protein [Halieaceae bacterium]|jgi:TRAP-type uncharacterized transport system substrate-binding protein